LTHQLSIPYNELSGEPIIDRHASFCLDLLCPAKQITREFILQLGNSSRNISKTVKISVK